MHWLDAYDIKFRKVAFLLLLASLTMMFPAFFLQPIAAADYHSHNLFLQYFTDALRDGSLYPRWLHGMYAGCGDATFFFYSPLAQFLAAPFVLLGAAPGDAFVFAMLPITWFSGLAMYRYLREYAAASHALIASMVYLFLPTHVTAYFITGSYSEYTAFMAVPLILLSLRRIIRGEYRYGVLLAASGSIVLYSSVSNLVAIFLLLPLYAVYEWLQAEKPASRLLGIGATFVAAALFSALLSAALLVPFIAERPHVYIGHHFNAMSDVADSFLLVAQLIWVMTIVFSFAPAIYLLLQLQHVATGREERRAVWFLVLLLLYLLFLLMPASMWLWKHAPIVSQLQYPLKILFCVPFPLALIIARSLRHTHILTIRNIIRTIAIIGLCYPILMAGMFRNSEPLEFINEYGVRAVHEYLPAQVKRERWHNEHLRKVSAEECREQTFVLVGAAQVNVSQWSPYHIALEVVADAPSTIRLGRFYYPHWRITDGTANIGADEATGQMVLQVPAGTQGISLAFAEPPHIAQANTLSLGMWLLALIGIWRWRRMLFSAPIPDPSSGR